MQTVILVGMILSLSFNLTEKIQILEEAVMQFETSPTLYTSFQALLARSVLENLLWLLFNL